MGKVFWKGGALLAPVPPVMVTCSDGEKDNIITVAWTGIVNTNPPKTYISVRPSRYSYGMIKKSGEFVINLTTADMIRAADFCGVRSGRDIDKFEVCSLTKGEANVVKCPTIEESPMSIECRVESVTSYGTHDMFVADIVGVNVDEALIDRAGKLHLERADIAAFAHGEYFSLGRKLGFFGFSVKKKKKNHKKGKKV